jgi:EAL domain-containing protein (putative c-di-GMP-specific phosphodiesterase class I)
VEKAEQLEYLTSQGCTLIQGYFTGHPLAPEAAQARLRQGPRGAVRRLEHLQ